MTNFKIVSFIFTHTAFSCDKEMQDLSFCANKEMKVLGQEISRDEVRQATNPNKNLKIKRLHSSLFFLSWRNCEKGYFAIYYKQLGRLQFGVQMQTHQTPLPLLLLCCKKHAGEAIINRGVWREWMLHFKDTTQDEKCPLSPNKQAGTKQGVHVRKEAIHKYRARLRGGS